MQPGEKDAQPPSGEAGPPGGTPASEPGPWPPPPSVPPPTAPPSVPPPAPLVAPPHSASASATPDGQVMYFTANGPVTFPMPPGGMPSVPQRKRRRTGLWVTLGIVMTFVLCWGGTAAVAYLGGLPEGFAASGSTLTEDQVSDKVMAAFRAQSEGLAKGDRRAFVDATNPTGQSLIRSLSLQYDNLYALGATQMRHEISFVGTPDRRLNGTEWEISVNLSLCLGVPSCAPEPDRVETVWRERGGDLSLIRLSTIDDTDNGPRPWELDELTAVVGKRAIVATTTPYADRLPELAAAAERAAKVADRFVLSDPKVDRYRVFLGGDVEYGKWYGGNDAEWSVGFAVYVHEGRSEVVINLDLFEGDDIASIEEVMRHELGHVATLTKRGRDMGQHFWLVEGIAEYIAEQGRPVSKYPGLRAVTRAIEKGTWDGDIVVVPPRDNTEDDVVGADYGVGYLAVRCLADRYGEAKMLEFFRWTVHFSNLYRESSEHAFGRPWGEVKAACSRYVRNAAARGPQ